MAGVLLPIALGIFGMLLAGGDEEAAPPPPVPGGAPPMPPPKGVEAATEVHMVDGIATSYFKPSVAAPILAALQSASVTPADLSTLTQTGPVALAIEAQKAGKAFILSVVPQNPAIANAAVTIGAALNQGLAVVGTLNLIFLEGVGRAIILCQPALRPVLCAVDHRGPLAVLADVAERAIPAPPGPYGKGPTPMPDKQPELPTSPPAGIPAPPVGDGLDPSMPESVKRQVRALLEATDQSPEALELAARDLEPKYPMAAAKLRARASELRENVRLEHIKRGSSPFTVREGDLPGLVAAHYTGDQSRWREMTKAGKKVSQKNWYGTVDLPLAWEAWTKGLPARASGSLPTTVQKKGGTKEALGGKEYVDLEREKKGEVLA